jgi:hypothetical protein
MGNGGLALSMEGGKEELYRRLEQTRRLASAAHDPLTTERLKALFDELEEQIAASEARDTDSPPTSEIAMPGEWNELKQRLDDATRRLERPTDPLHRDEPLPGGRRKA